MYWSELSNSVCQHVLAYFQTAHYITVMSLPTCGSFTGLQIFFRFNLIHVRANLLERQHKPNAKTFRSDFIIFGQVFSCYIQYSECSMNGTTIINTLIKLCITM